jgi:hypothetical protein
VTHAHAPPCAQRVSSSPGSAPAYFFKGGVEYVAVPVADQNPPTVVVARQAQVRDRESERERGRGRDRERERKREERPDQNPPTVVVARQNPPGKRENLRQRGAERGERGETGSDRTRRQW